MNEAKVDSFLRQLAQLSAPDLRSLLSEVFPLRGYEGERAISYFNQSGHALSLIYLASRADRDPHGVIKELRREPQLTDDDVTRLRELLGTVQGDQADYLASFFHFSSRPVAGWWRYRDQFQILPPPSGAPVPDTVMGEWPFLIETRYSSPDGFGFKAHRRMQAMNRLRLLLPVLLIGPMFQPNTERYETLGNTHTRHDAETAEHQATDLGRPTSAAATPASRPVPCRCADVRAGVLRSRRPEHWRAGSLAG
jgi:hypothetical protein